MTSNSVPSLNSKKVYVSKVDGMGHGLFAKHDIKQGETIFIIKGKKIDLDIKDKSDSELLPNAIGYKPGVWLDPYPNNPLPYLNHSCSPNAGIKGYVTVVAMKNIKKGEHITIDYSITECDELWTLPELCQCGERSCRKVIRAIQSLPDIIYKKYLPYIPAAMQQEYRSSHSI